MVWFQFLRPCRFLCGCKPFQIALKQTNGFDRPCRFIPRHSPPQNIRNSCRVARAFLTISLSRLLARAQARSLSLWLVFFFFLTLSSSSSAVHDGIPFNRRRSQQISRLHLFWFCLITSNRCIINKRSMRRLGQMGRKQMNHINFQYEKRPDVANTGLWEKMCMRYHTIFNRFGLRLRQRIEIDHCAKRLRAPCGSSLSSPAPRNFGFFFRVVPEENGNGYTTPPFHIFTAFFIFFRFCLCMPFGVGLISKLSSDSSAVCPAKLKCNAESH